MLTYMFLFHISLHYVCPLTDLDKSVLLSPELRSPAKLAHLHLKLSSPQRRKLLDSEESRKLLENRLVG